MAEPKPKGYSRRDALYVLGGIGAGLATGGTIERRVLAPNPETELKRRQYDELLGILTPRTNLDDYYPGGFASVSDEQLLGLLVKQSLTDPNTGNTRTLYQLGIPRDITTPSGAGIPAIGEFRPAIETVVDTYREQPSAPHLVLIVSHFFPVDTPDGSKKLMMFNYDHVEPPKLPSLKEPELRTLVGPLFKNPNIPVFDDWSHFDTVSTRKPQGVDIYKVQKDFVDKDRNQIVGIALEEDATCVYYELNFGGFPVV